jgi:type I restriction enzyme S subunit
VKAGWETKLLGDVCDWQRGLTYTKTDEVDVSENIVLRATNIDLATNLLDLDELKYINEKVIVPDSKKIKVGSLIICTASGSKSHLGKVAYIDDDYGYAFGGFMGMLTPKHELYSKFLFHLMTSPAYKDFIAALSDGANINNLKFDDLKQFVIPVPPLPEQHRIVAILDSAFDYIATARANCEANLLNARAIFESHLQEVFTQRGEGWVEKPLDEVSKVINGHSFKSSDFSAANQIKTIKITNVGVKEFVDDSSSMLPASFKDGYSAFSVNAGSIVIALTRTIIQAGLKVAVVPSLYHGALLNQRVAAIVANRKYVLDAFIYLYLSTNQVEQYVKNHVNTLMQPNLSINDLKALAIPLPSIDEQQEIIEKLENLSQETERLEYLYQRKLQALDDLKKSLLHQAFSGML